MKKSKLAIIIVALIVICATVAISFASFDSSKKKGITIETGDKIGIEVDTSEDGLHAIFADEEGAKLVPREAEVLSNNNGTYKNEAPSSSGKVNKIALAGLIKLKVTGAIVKTLKFTVGDIMMGNKSVNDYVDVCIFMDYSKTFDKYTFVNEGKMPTKQSSPHFLGATYGDNEYVGGTAHDTETIKPMPVGEYKFTILVYFKTLANLTPDLSQSSINFGLTIEALQ